MGFLGTFEFSVIIHKPLYNTIWFLPGLVTQQSKNAKQIQMQTQIIRFLTFQIIRPLDY